MFSKKNVLLSAKVSLCAMLMLLTASVASASETGDFGFTDVGNSYLSSSSVNNLTLEVVIPDGVNGNTEDLLIKAGSAVYYSGEALVPFPALGSGVTGVGYFEAVPNGYNGTEPIVRDLDNDSVWTASADTDIGGTAPSAGDPITTTKNAADWNELYFYDAVGGGAWAAGTDMIFSDDGTIVHDSGLDTLLAGGNINDAFSVSTVPASWNFGFYDAVNADAYNGAADWIGIDDDGDLVLTTAADTLVIDGTDGLPAAGAGLYSIGILDEVCSDNIVMASATCVYTDTDGTPCDGTQGSGADILGVGCEVAGDTLIAGVSNWATNKGTLDATTDWFTENVPGPFTYSAAADTLIDGVAPGAGTLLSSSKSWSNMYFHYFAPGTPWDPVNDLVFLDDGNVYYDTGGFTADVLEAGVAVTTLPGTLTEPANWDLWYRDAAGADNYDGTVDWIGVDAGGTATYSATADDDVYAVGGLTNTDTLTGFSINCDGLGGVQSCLHTGGGTIDSTKSIMEDEGTGQGAAPNGVVDVAADQLNGIEIKNNGTATDADLASVNVWADGGDNTFDAGPGDDIFLGAAAWDATDSWDLTGLVYPISAGGIKLYVSLDMAANPAHAQTFILALVQNGLTVASTNDGPTDADASPSAATNTKTIYNSTSSSGGSSGGSSYLCGNNNVDDNETCDDGGRTSGDGCNAYCDLEEGYVWDAENEVVLLEADLPVVEETTTEEVPVDAEAVTEEELPVGEVADVSDNFSDYDATHWAAEYIAKLYNAGIMSGPGDGTFGVAIGTTRAEIVKIALLANGIEVAASVDEAPFLDTPIGEWYAPYVSKAAELGIVSGYGDGNFRPGNTVNRAEALKILLLAKGVDLEGYDLSSATSFSDVSESIWYAVYVAYAVDMGLVEGYDDGTFRAINDILRAEIAKLTVVIMLLDIGV